MDKQLTIKGTYDIDKPSQVTSMAAVLKKHIVSNQLYTPIAGKNYAHVEGWQFAGGIMGLFPRIVRVENLSTGAETKWQAEVEIVERKTGKVISSGFALCSNKENNKKRFDEYAVLSMAQTRAIGKAYRNLLGWVMKLAGYEATPSEEMVKMGEVAVDVSPDTKNPATVAKNAKNGVSTAEFACAKCKNPITKAEKEFSLKVFKKVLCRTCQKEARK